VVEATRLEVDGVGRVRFESKQPEENLVIREERGYVLEGMVAFKKGVFSS